MPQQAYSYHQAPAFHRQPASHKTTSAFSSSANPNEDWTQMSNLAERRRIQNRIAQRNYRAFLTILTTTEIKLIIPRKKTKAPARRS